MKNFIAAGLLVCLACLAPLTVAASAPSPAGAAAQRSIGQPSAQPFAADTEATRDYAAREAAAPALAEFRGGDVGIYIGGSAVTVLLVVLLVVIIL
jgi:hypothetical protein